uniref:Synaptobrevin, longin-like domain protein n=1 Tax=Tanacetum cinerariifolium TaxID=118510 RepID=A0A699HQ75_TANCI|nr:hypothetical protein [Tanacetum cinerariifolium]
MTPLTFAETHNMIAFLSKKKVVVTEDIIHQDLRLDDADGVECFPNEEILVELARMGYEKPPPKLTFYKAFFFAQWKFLIHTLVRFLINNQVDDLFSHKTKYTSPALTQKVFDNMRRIGGCVQTKGRIEAIDADEDITLVNMENKVDVDAELQGRIERKDDDNVIAQEVNVVEPIVFDDEEVTITMAQTLIKMKAKKARILNEQIAKRLHNEEIKQAVAREKQEQDDFKRAQELQQQKYQNLKRKPISIAQARKNMILYLKNMAGYKIAHFKGMTYDQESFKKLRAEAEVSGSLSTQDTPTDDPKEMSKEDVKNMLQIVPVSEFKVKALQVKLTKENLSTAMPTEDKEKALWVELKRLYEPNTADVFWKQQRYMHDPLTWKLYTNYGVHQVLSTRRNNIFMFLEKDYPLTDVVLLLMLSTKLQVDEDCEIAKDLVMKTFMGVNKPKSRISLDTSSK